MVILRVEVSYPTLEEFNQLQRRESHQEVLNSPLTILLACLILSVMHLSVDITTQIQKEVNYVHKLLFVS